MRRYFSVLGIYFVLALGLQAGFTPESTRSVALGILACFVPNAWLYLRVHQARQSDVVTWLHSFRRAETVKFLFTVMIFGLMFKFSPNLSYITVFANYAVAIAIETLWARRVAASN